MMLSRFRALAAIAALAVLPLPALADISPGTQLTGSMDQTLNSKDVQVGQAITVSNAYSGNHDINGATIYGHVASVQRAGQGTKAQIELAFDKVNTRSGNVYKIIGRATHVQVNTKSNATKEILSGAGGALVGGLLGGKIGAVLGGGAGVLYSKNSKENVTIPGGSLVTVQITQAYKQKT